MSASAPGPARLTPTEWRVLALTALGLTAGLAYGGIAVKEAVVFYLAGLFFEVITDRMWIYNPEIKTSFFTLARTDINLLVSSGWVGVAGLSVSLARLLGDFLPALHPLAGLFLSFFLVGNAIESLYLALGTFRYDAENFWLKFPFGRMVTIAKVPWAVRLGYGTLMPGMTWLILKNY